MSEYQYVAFRAVDGPVSDKNLEYMRRQSSRAEITPWSFDNEYHFGDFHGHAVEMLRRGYDIHLHYANFGTRTLLIRLPHGFPDPGEVKPYLMKDSLHFSKDKQGPGGTLQIEPFLEPGDLDELWEIDEWIDRLVPLRAEILAGDLRPLYLAHLAVSCDSNHDPDETREAPVPAGLSKLTDAQTALAEFYGLGEALLTAAAQESPAISSQDDPAARHAEWIERQAGAAKNVWLASLMTESHSGVRADLLAQFRKDCGDPPWPTVRTKRTIAQLQAEASEIAQKVKRQTAAKMVRDRAKRLADMAAAPAPTLRETEQLVALRSTDNYRKIGELLAELREALAGGKQSSLAEQQARKLTKENPTLTRLTAELRRKGFVPK